MPIDILRAFYTVVTLKGFTRAAEHLGRSRPTISLQVKRLEELIGRPLFENNLRLTLTSIGAICFEHVGRILNDYDQMISAIEDNKVENNCIRIGVPAEMATLVMPQLSLTGTQNSCKFDIYCDDQNVLIGNYNSNILDIVLICHRSTELSSKKPIWRAPIAWACAPGYVVPRSEPLSVILPPPGSLYRQLAIDSLAATGRRYEIACVSANFNVLKAALDAKLGISPMIAPAIAALGMQEVQNLSSIAEINIALSSRSKKRASIFVDALSNVMDELF